MTTETHEYTVIRASEGYFLANADMTLYGYEIVLGKYDSPSNYRELPISEWPEIPEPEEPTPSDPTPGDQTPGGPNEEPVQEPVAPDQLELAKASKLRDITAYDMSTNVNGFRLNGNLMWLDRETRASLRNTIESATLVGRTELDIWFGDALITLPIGDARMMLAVLEVYATDCYNVTAQHRVQVRNMTELSDVEAFDVTAGYPTMPEFGTTNEPTE